jgi:hypothetical protein
MDYITVLYRAFLPGGGDGPILVLKYAQFAPGEYIGMDGNKVNLPEGYCPLQEATWIPLKWGSRGSAWADPATGAPLCQVAPYVLMFHEPDVEQEDGSIIRGTTGLQMHHPSTEGQRLPDATQVLHSWNSQNESSPHPTCTVA